MDNKLIKKLMKFYRVTNPEVFSPDNVSITKRGQTLTISYDVCCGVTWKDTLITSPRLKLIKKHRTKGDEQEPLLCPNL